MKSEELGGKREWINDYKKTVTRNCTQYSFTWVFVTLVHFSNLYRVFCC